MAYSPSKPYQKRDKGLAWSNTRITVLERCERKYYFNYYTFALKEPHPDLRAETVVLKGLKSLEMRIGEKSHYLLSDYLHLLKQGTVEPEKITEIKEQLKAEMESEFQLSKERNYQEYTDFYKKFGFSEHFYGENIDDQLPLAITKVLGNLDRFIESKRNDKVQDYFSHAKFIYVEQPRTPNFEIMKVDISKLPGLEHISVFASPDF
jgi:hydroxymethylpyrimidine pyrophosphatase-like HAD family hydrolase